MTSLSQLHGNKLRTRTIAGLPFELTYDSAKQCAGRIDEIIAATTHIDFIRKRATEICIGLQDLELPAFVTLAIIDEAVHENSIRMWAKWELITAAKHFRDRRESRIDECVQLSRSTNAPANSFPTRGGEPVSP